METLQDKRFADKLDLVISLLNDNNINIHKLIATYKDSELISKVLGLNPVVTQEDLSLLEEKLVGNEHHKDFRDTISFARNLIINWLLEDLIYYKAIEGGLEVQHTGNDGQRELLKGWKASSDPDLFVKLNVQNQESEIWCEVIANFPTKNFDSFWEETGYFDLRDYKLKNLLNKAKTKKTIVLGINVKQKKFFTFQIHDQIESLDYSAEEKFGNKLTKKVMFPGGKPTLNSFDKLPYILKNITRQKIYKPLQKGNELESLITQYFEVQRGFCVFTPSTDRNLLHVKGKVVTDEAQMYYVYYQQAEDNHTIHIPVDHILNDYDWGFQYSPSEKDKLYYWEGSVLKHHIEYNLNKKKVWEVYLSRDKLTLILPTKYVPSINIGKLSEDFQKIL